MILETHTEDWTNEAACARRARALAAHASLRRASIELQGPLGAGKTSFVRALLQALGVTGRIKSPSYAIVEPYELPGLPVWHFDLYRFADPREWHEAGLHELYGAPGLKLTEWPEQGAGVLPEPDLRLQIEPQAGGVRRVTFTALTSLGQELLP